MNIITTARNYLAHFKKVAYELAMSQPRLQSSGEVSFSVSAHSTVRNSLLMALYDSEHFQTKARNFAKKDN